MKTALSFLGWTKFWYSLIWLAADYGTAFGETPAHVLASVRTLNGGIKCSGTIISKGPEWAAGVTAAHCFTGKIGGTFWVYYPDGSTTDATLLAHDPKRDLALFKVPSKTVLAISQLPDRDPQPGSVWNVCGYPGGEGPMHYELKVNAAPVSNAAGMWRWAFDVTGDGAVFSGNSGCGVFSNGQTVGVLSHRDEYNNGKTLYCAPYSVMQAFLQENAGKARDCDGWWCPIKRRNGEQPPAPPGGVPPPWTPRPNVPIKPYDGRGSRPPDLDSDKDMAREIDALRKLVTELQKRVDQKPEEREEPAPLPPVKGDKGDAGPPGLSATDGQVQAAVTKWLEKNATAISGADGKPGRSGTVTLELFWKDGETIATLKDLAAGSKVKLPLEKVPHTAAK